MTGVFLFYSRKRITTKAQKIARPFLKDFFAEINVAFKKSSNILCAFELLNVDNLNQQQSELVNVFEPSIQALASFNGTEQVDEFQRKESQVDVITDKEEVMKELSDFLLDSKDDFQCHNKKTKQAAELKEKLLKEKKSADKKRKWLKHSLMKIILPFLFGVTLWLINMKQKSLVPT